MSTSWEDGRTLLVVGKRIESSAVMSFELADPSGAALPGWEPGAHIDVMCGTQLVRQYSLCGQPGAQARWRIGVLRELQSRGGSAYLHDTLHVGDKVDVRGPRNNFPLVDAPSYLFIAGGIGITPLLPMLGKVFNEGKDWRLVYGGRTRGSMAFLDEFARYGDRVQVQPQDERGLLDLPAVLSWVQPTTAVYCCGPGPLITAVEQALPPEAAERLHSERFTATEVAPPVSDDGFDVVLRRSGLVLRVPPEQSVLDVLLDAGVEVDSSCEEGVCGTCETSVLSGRIDHRDHILTAAARERGDRMYVCVSRSKGGPLELDV